MTRTFTHLLAVVIVVLTVAACKKKNKEDAQTVYITKEESYAGISTLPVDSINGSVAISGGICSSEGSSAVTAVGICWDTKPGPTTLRSRTWEGAGTGQFRSVMNNLQPSTTYYVRAYATNALGTAYGNEMSFKTPTGWTFVSNPNLSSNKLFSSGNRILAARSFFYGVSYSDDNGMTWTTSNTASSYSFYDFATLNSSVFAATNGGVYMSPDNGASWGSSNGSSNLSSQYVNDILVDNNTIYAGTQYGGVYRSATNGATWQSSTSGLSGAGIVALAASGGNIIAGTYNQGIYISSDGGIIWNSSNQGLSEMQISDLVVSGGKVFAACTDGVYVSTNNGVSWTKVNNLPLSFPNMVAKDANVVAWNYSTPYVSNNNGTTWSLRNGGLMNQVTTICIHGSFLFANTGSAIYKTPVQ